MDDIDLPPVPSSARQTTTNPLRPSILLTRKRTYTTDDDPATSSDPALFSSDEHAPDAENYVSGKRKKHTYQGSWWDHGRVNMTNSKKRVFRRNFDSGVFMGSETSDEGLSSDSFGLEDELLRDQRERDRRSQGSPSFTSKSVETTPKGKTTVSRPMVSVRSSQHDAVCETVRLALDQGKEDVDLSAMLLSTLPSEVTSLKTLSKQAEIVPGMLDVGTDLEAKLRLYLGNNLFVQFPTPVLDLRNLRVLSLRQNHITSIPPAIRELVNLESLNVAGNQLQELPFEIIELVKFHSLRVLTTDPNPFTETLPDGFQVEELRAFEVAPDTAVPKLYRRTVWDFFGDESQSTTKTSIYATNFGVPSLRELALRKLSQLDPLSQMDFGDFMPEDSPDSILEDLSLLKTQPGRRCTRCHRAIVLAAKQWTERWQVSHGNPEHLTEVRGAFVPFTRLLCSERCSGQENSWCDQPLDCTEEGSEEL